MYEEDNYIQLLKEKLENIKEEDLKKLIYRLIDERNYLSNVVNIDPLTGLYNRRILERIRDCNIALMCDIDNFKEINDTYGHDVGDYVIKNIGSVLHENTRINDYVCRLGGDEFFIGFTNCEYDFILERCEKIKKEINDRIKLPNHTVTISIGIALNKENESITSLMKKADEALYTSKNNGKNQVSFYEERQVKL